MESLTNRNHVLAQFTTNGFVGNPMSSIAMATVSGMSIMFITISLKAPATVSVIGLLAGIVLVYGYRVASIRYTLTTDGITQRIRRFIPYKLNKNEEERHITWSDIKSFKNDWDRNRSGANYEYLKLYLTKSPGEIWITDEKDAQGFNEFKDAFREQIEAGETALNAPSKPSPVVKSKTSHIQQKTSFYNTWFAKVLTIFFGLLVVGLFAYGEINGWRYSNQLKFQAVLLPGTVYMVYRVFLKKLS